MPLMSPRTSLVLDEDVRRAARQLARYYDCSTSEAIRRAILHQRDAVLGPPAEHRQRRRRAVELLIRLSEGSDPEAEVRRLKREDAGF
jgi:hypothetical protein